MIKTFISLVTMLLIAATLQAQTPIGSRYSWNNLPKAELPVFSTDTFSVVKYGAVPDGVSLNTASIQKAIDDCSKNGGVVLFPEGVWMTGPIVLKSKVNLHFQKNAVLLFSSNFDLYPLVEANWEGKPTYRNQSPISGKGLENIAITGKGFIDGNGDFWRCVFKSQLTEPEWNKKVSTGGVVSDDGKSWYPSLKFQKGQNTPNAGLIIGGKTAKDYDDIKDYLRPNLLVLDQCKRVLLEGVTFQNSPAWCLHPLMCSDLTLKAVKVKNPDYAQNGDGIDVESCKNVLLEDCTFDVGDDGICIKSGKDKYGRKRGIPAENIVIRNCTVYKGHGGFVVGSEMSGGVHNIFVTDCTFLGTDKGIRFKTARGRGGIVENIFIRNIMMKDIQQEAIFFDMYYFMKVPGAGEKQEIPPVTEATPLFRNIEISNVICSGAEKGIFMRGLPEMAVKNITISNCTLNAKKSSEFTDAKDITLNKVKLVVAESDPIKADKNNTTLTIK